VHSHIHEAEQHGWLLNSREDPEQSAVDTVRYGRVLFDIDGHARLSDGGLAEEGTDIEQRHRAFVFLGGDDCELVQG
jgi:hypothetical protein